MSFSHKSGVCNLVPPVNAARASGNLDLVEEAFQNAIEANPVCIEAYLNLARDERTLQHLNRFASRPEAPEGRSTDSQVIAIWADDMTCDRYL